MDALLSKQSHRDLQHSGGIIFICWCLRYGALWARTQTLRRCLIILNNRRTLAVICSRLRRCLTARRVDQMTAAVLRRSRLGSCKTTMAREKGAPPLRITLCKGRQLAFLFVALRPSILPNRCASSNIFPALIRPEVRLYPSLRALALLFLLLA